MTACFVTAPLSGPAGGGSHAQNEAEAPRHAEVSSCGAGRRQQRGVRPHGAAPQRARRSDRNRKRRRAGQRERKLFRGGSGAADPAFPTISPPGDAAASTAGGAARRGERLRTRGGPARSCGRRRAELLKVTPHRPPRARSRGPERPIPPRGTPLRAAGPGDATASGAPLPRRGPALTTMQGLWVAMERRGPPGRLLSGSEERTEALRLAAAPAPPPRSPPSTWRRRRTARLGAEPRVVRASAISAFPLQGFRRALGARSPRTQLSVLRGFLRRRTECATVLRERAPVPYRLTVLSPDRACAFSLSYKQMEKDALHPRHLPALSDVRGFPLNASVRLHVMKTGLSCLQIYTEMYIRQF